MLTPLSHFRRIASLLIHFLTEAGQEAKGAVAVELAIIAPALMLMFVCTVDFGMGVYRKMQVQNAAQAGAEYAIAHGYTDAISAAVTNATSFSGITASPAPVQFCGCPASGGVTTTICNSTCLNGSAAGTYVTVSAQGTYSTILPYPSVPSTFSFTSRATVRIQ